MQRLQRGRFWARSLASYGVLPWRRAAKTIYSDVCVCIWIEKCSLPFDAVYSRPTQRVKVKVKVNGVQQLATSLNATGTRVPYGRADIT